MGLVLVLGLGLVLAGPDHGDARLVLRLVGAERRDAVAWRNPSVVGDEDVLVLVGEFSDGGAERHVNSGADITSAEGLDGEIWVDFANDLRGVSMGEMSFAVQQNGHHAVSVDCGLVASQLRDLADNGDDAADKVVEVRGGDARGGHLLRHGDELLFCRFMLYI